MPSFGTDGIRGVAGVDLTDALAERLGRAAAAVLPGGTWLVGADTRASGPGLVAALAAGLTAAGRDVVDLGVLPTPGVAFHGQRRHAPAAVVSASHNPWTDNGIKLLGAGGVKLADDVEAAIARAMYEDMEGNVTPSPSPGALAHDPDPAGPYLDHLSAALAGRRLDSLSIVLDCANGAASRVAPAAFRAAGARVRVLNDAPDGTNINAGCGSTHPAALQQAVVDAGADAGLAFDGDADRVLAVDHTGALVDGDHIIGICALDAHRRGTLLGDGVVITVMSNLGLRLALAAAGIEVVETPVGDRYVLSALDERGLALGGEQSGHVIFRDLATTGDGTLTGLLLLDIVARTRTPLAGLSAAAMTRLPQVLRNVRVQDRDAVAFAREVWHAAAAEDAALGDTGRVLLRPSGTEPLVRVMVEAPTLEQATAVADRLAGLVASALGG